MAISSLGQSTSYYQAIGQAKVAAASVWDVICLVNIGFCPILNDEDGFLEEFNNISNRQ